MFEKSFNKFCFGFLFILLSFRVKGFDILPDIVGYILFALSFSALAEHSEHFEKAKVFNYIMIFLSIFSIYQRPEDQGEVVIQTVIILLSIAATIINLIVVYHIFAGIIEMATVQRKPEILDEADKKWTQYIVIQLAAFGLFVFIIIPNFAIVYSICLVIATIAYTVTAMSFMKKCGVNLN